MIKVLVSLVIGALCGSIGNKIMGGNKKGFFMNAVLGLIGGAVGGYLGGLIGIGDGWISSILLSIAGSCLIIWIARKLGK